MQWGPVMKTWNRRAVVATAACLLAGCRFAGAEDLLGSVPTSDAGASSPSTARAGAPEEVPTAPRLQAAACLEPGPPAPSVMVDVPAGAFPMGCNVKTDAECKADEHPAHAVVLASFRLDATEVTQAQYNECVLAGACLAPTCDWSPCSDRGQHPVVCINISDARAYCAFEGKRLPTEAEWEKAARGDGGHKFPWGDAPIDCAHANLAGCTGGTEPVGSHPAGASPYGALDMAGNVVEWVSDIYDPKYYAATQSVDPRGPGATSLFPAYVGRGGGWNSTEIWHRASARDDYEGTYFKKTFGVRCARSVP